VSCGEAAQVLGCLILVLPGDNSDEEQKRRREEEKKRRREEEKKRRREEEKKRRREEEKKRRREEEKKSFWVSEVTFLNFY
jgi:hypothetical protein